MNKILSTRFNPLSGIVRRRGGGVQQKCYKTQKAEPGIGLNKGTVIISIKYFRVLAKTMD